MFVWYNIWVKELLKSRPLSWSAISSFEYDPSQWYDTYILGNRQSSREMTFGSKIDKQFQDDPTFFPTIPRGEKIQYKMKVNFSGIPLVGVPDILSFEKEQMLADLKTGKKLWDKKRADETGQLSMYLLLIYITHKIKPEKFKCYIHWLPTQDNGDFSISLVKDCKPITIETKRTMADLLRFGERINTTVRAMDEYIKFRKLSPCDKLTHSIA